MGDALGAPVEFLKWPEITKQFGEGGIRVFVPAYGQLGAITDDTQMTLFTAEGLLRAHVSGQATDLGSATNNVGDSLLRWLVTQGRPVSVPDGEPTGLLSGFPELASARAPGTTCLQALQTLKLQYETPRAENDSKGCGGIMRSAPIGLITASLGLEASFAFQLGCLTAGLTHGHPSGFLSAGFFASVIHELVSGASLDTALDRSIELLQAQQDHEQTSRAVVLARELAGAGASGQVVLSRLGEGWVAEEALAIGLYCALVAPNLEEGVVLAVNHSGDSDSTGSIAGNLLGAVYGVESIPGRWLAPLELRGLITEVADDLATAADWHLESELYKGEELNVELLVRRERYPQGERVRRIELGHALESIELETATVFVKIVEMLQQNWAIIESRPSLPQTVVYFFDDFNRVFDELRFSDPEAAKRGLQINGFRPYTEAEFGSILGPRSGNLTTGGHPNGRIYSSGRFWRRLAIS